MDLVTAPPDHAGIGCPRQRAALATFSSYALGDPDLDELLEEATRAVAEALCTLLCRVMQYRADEDDLVLRAGMGWPPGTIGRLKVPADQTNPMGKAFLSGVPLITPDVSALAGCALPPAFAQLGITSSVCVPIHGSNGAFGILGVDTTESREFTDDDVEFLGGFARVIAEAIGRVRRKRALTRALRKKEALATERGVLLREMQHRVRNHLQLVHASLNIQARRTQDAAARQGFQEVAGQVLALSTLYDHLLGVGMGQTIDLAAYLSSLCGSMARVGGRPGEKVNLAFSSAGPVPLGLDRCTALGIVVNELVSNALEHAFPDGGGTVTVSLGSAGPGDIVLTIADDGRGLDPQVRRGVGMTLVERLVKQVDGSLELNTSKGTVWRITIPV